MDKTTFSLDVWDDDTRMSVFFAPFREKSLNPSSWNQKMTFWVQKIKNESMNNQSFIIDIKILQSKFTRKGKIPLCLDTVIEEMLRSKAIRKLSNIGTSPVKPKSSWLTWGYDTFLKTPVTWGISYLSTHPSTAKNIKYIVLDVLNKKCDELVNRHYCGLYCDVTDSLIDYNQLWKKSQSVCNSEEELNLILEELVKQKKIIIHHENAQTIIKFANREDKTVKPVSKNDMDIFRIKMTRDMLTDRIDNFTATIEKLKKEALRLKKSSQTKALRCLRQKRLIENRIEKLTGSLDILDNIMDQITHCVSDEMVVKALESGNSVMKTLSGKMSSDHVADVMAELGEVLEEQAEIQDQLSSGPSGLDVSREDLEAELDDLMKDDTEQKNSDLLIDDIISGFSGLHLPTVPSASVEAENHTPEKIPVSGSMTPRNTPVDQKYQKTSPGDISSPGSSFDPVSRSQTKSPEQASRSPICSKDNIHQSVNTDSLHDIFSEKFDLSLELPDVPTFIPTFDNDKKEACLDS